MTRTAVYCRISQDGSTSRTPDRAQASAPSPAMPGGSGTARPSAYEGLAPPGIESALHGRSARSGGESSDSTDLDPHVCCGGVVVHLPSRPPHPILIGELGLAGLTDQPSWSLLIEYSQDLRPIGQAERIG